MLCFTVFIYFSCTLQLIVNCFIGLSTIVQLVNSRSLGQLHKGSITNKRIYLAIGYVVKRTTWKVSINPAEFHPVRWRCSHFLVTSPPLCRRLAGICSRGNQATRRWSCLPSHAVPLTSALGVHRSAYNLTTIRPESCGLEHKSDSARYNHLWAASLSIRATLNRCQSYAILMW